MQGIVIASVSTVVGVGGLLLWFFRRSKQSTEPQPGSSSDGAGNSATELFKECNMFDRLKDYFRSRRAEGKSAEAALSSAQTAFGHDFSIEMFLRAALFIGYPSSEVVAYMILHAFQPEEIVRFLWETSKLSVNELVDLIAPFVAGNSIIDRADEVFVIMRGVFRELPESDERFLKLPARLGCSDEDAVRIIHANSSLKLGYLIGRFRLQTFPESITKLVTELNVRLSRPDQYKALRDADVGFRQAVLVLKASGETVVSILEAENEYEGFSVDDVSLATEALLEAEFGVDETMNGIVDAKILDHNIFGALIRGVLGRNVKTSKIVSFLGARQVGLRVLESEMIAVKIDIYLRVEILYALCTASQPSAEAAEIAEMDEA